jgi:quinol monooxygenase YgiN
MTSTAAASRSPRTFLERDNWMRAMNASGEPRGARCLAFAIALHLNVETGRCDPGHKTLSKDAGISERSVERFVALLVRAGWLAITRGGRGHTNSYVLLRPASDLADQKHIRPASDLADQKSFDPPVPAHMTRQFEQHDPPHVGGQKERTAKRTEKGKRETLSRDVAAPDSEPVSEPQAEPPKQKPVRGSKAKVDIESAFAEFWAAYPRKEAKGAARKAFAAIIESGIDPAELIDGARRYAMLRSGEDPKYTKHAATWLRAECWTDEAHGVRPPIIDQHGNVVVAPAQPRPSRPQSFEEAAAELLAETDENDGYGGWGRPS